MPKLNTIPGLIIRIKTAPDEVGVCLYPHHLKALVGLKFPVALGLIGPEPANKTPILLKASREENSYRIARSDFLEAFKKQNGSNLFYDWSNLTEGQPYVYFSEKDCEVIDEGIGQKD